MTNLLPGNELFGFKIISVKEIKEYRLFLIRAVHKDTGFETVHLKGLDNENVFSFIFKTPCEDDTGIPHILEHSVLCGSKRFPVKDPFVLLLKGSMKTFLNAFTAPDCTMYVGSSTMEQDFFNLMLVYGDAVFSPLLRKEIFMQEGFHIELQGENKQKKNEMKLVGVVYNEMKGSYSNPESVVFDWSYRALFPDTPYRYEYGGDPEYIPDLTYSKFLAYYKKYYHPSNCRLFLYGNIETEKSLQFLQENFLSGFNKKVINATIPLQKRWSAPKIVRKTYPVAKTDNLKNKSSVTINWLTGSVCDPRLLLSFEILSEILVGNAGSPLRQVMVEAGLGEDISPATGIELGLREMVFSVGIRGTEQTKMEEIEKLVLNTLSRIQKEKWDKTLIDAALHRIEFRNREIASSGGPYGLRLLMRMLRGWLHDIDPEQTLEFSKEFWRFRNRGEGNEEYLKNLIKDYLIDNNHRTTLVVTPNPEHQEGIEKKIIDKLAPLIKDEKKRQEINKTFKQLETFQNEQDSEDDLKKLPSLSISDLPQKPPVIHLEDMEITESIPLYYCDTYTGGIVYIDFAFDITGLDRDLLPYLTFFESALCGVGLPGLGYNKIARRLALLTGGFWGSANINTIVRRNECKIFLIFRTKMLEIKIKEALNLIFDLFLHADFTDTQRLKDIFFELKNSFRSSLIPSGSFYAALRAGSFSSYPLFLEEQIRGITQILFLSKMAGNNNVHKYDKKLQDMKNTIIAKNRLIVNMTCERKNFNKNKECIENKVSSLPVRKLLTDSHQSGFIKGKKKIESLAVTTSINFNAKVLSTSPYGTKENALLSVISHLLNTGYLWEKVRMQGGAYGASISFYGTDGTLVFSSYRDPNILSTLKAFREAVVLIRDNKIKKDQIEKAIIGTVAKSEKPFTPGKRGYLGFKRKLYGITDEMRQKNRDIILSADSETLSEVANKLLENWDETSQVVISNKSSILKESKCMKELKDSMQILPL